MTYYHCNWLILLTDRFMEDVVEERHEQFIRASMFLVVTRERCLSDQTGDWSVGFRYIFFTK